MTARDWRTPVAVLICGSVIVSVALGVRHGFGLFLQPMTMDRGWGREVFALAMAVQNLLWGAAQPVFGMIADKYGPGRVVATGALLYVAGLIGMASAATPAGLLLYGGVMIGVGQAGVTFSVINGVIGRAFPPEKRSQVFGISAAAGSFGQFALLPFSQILISNVGWLVALLALSAVAFLMIPLSAALVERRRHVHADQKPQSVREALREAFGARSYVLLTAGFFVCGFQVVFIGVHLPSYLLDKGLPAHVGVTALALIGLFNIVGTLTSGKLGARLPKRYILSTIYLGRSATTALFLLAPLSPLSVYLFAIVTGLLWLSTVPPTNSIVAQVFGVRYLAMLSGFVFFSHQVGSFFGSWLGGYLFDRTGSYNTVWTLSIALGLFAALVHLPIDERPIAAQRRAAAT